MSSDGAGTWGRSSRLHSRLVEYAVLQTAVPVSDGSDQEEVAVQGQLPEEGRLLRADARQIAPQAGLVATVAPADGHAVGDSAHGEGDQAEAAHLHRVVDEVFVAARLVTAEAQWRCVQGPQAGGDLPVGAAVPRWRHQLDDAGERVLPGHPEEEGGPVEVGMAGVQVGPAHREVPGIDPVAHRQCQAAGCQAPRLFVALLQGNGPGGVLGGDVQDVAGEVPDHVAPGDPGRHGQGQCPGGGPVDDQLDPEEVGLGFGRGDAVGQVHRGSWLGATGLSAVWHATVTDSPLGTERGQPPPWLQAGYDYRGGGEIVSAIVSGNDARV